MSETAYVYYCPDCGKVKSCGVGVPGVSEEGWRSEVVSVEVMRAGPFCRCPKKKRPHEISR